MACLQRSQSGVGAPLIGGNKFSSNVHSEPIRRRKIEEERTGIKGLEQEEKLKWGRNNGWGGARWREGAWEKENLHGPAPANAEERFHHIAPQGGTLWTFFPYQNKKRGKEEGVKAKHSPNQEQFENPPHNI